MNRRDFIVSAIGAAAMAAVPATKKATLLHDAAHHDISGGFGLATVKQEGTTVLYDQGERLARALARSMMQTKEAVASKVLGEAFDVDHEEEDGYTYRTYKTGKRIIG
jgi:siroheme synthase